MKNERITIIWTDLQTQTVEIYVSPVTSFCFSSTTTIFSNLTANFSPMQSFSELNNHFLHFSDTEKLAAEHLLPKKEVCRECSLIVRVFNLPYKEYLNSLLEKCLLYPNSSYFILFQVSSSWLSKTVLKCQKPLFPILLEYLILHSRGSI